MTQLNILRVNKSYKNCNVSQSIKRSIIGKMLTDKTTSTEVAKQYSIKASTVRSWKKSVTDGDVMMNKRGRPTNLDDEAVQEVVEISKKKRKAQDTLNTLEFVELCNENKRKTNVRKTNHN